MNNRLAILAALSCAALLAGCATQRELIGQRIAQKPAFFAALPAEDQQRLREGQLAAGDPRDAAWIVYGKPDRVFQKVTPASTNEVWSYVTQDLSAADESRPVYHPVPLSRGRPYSLGDDLWATDRYSGYEYLRIEFQNGRVLTIESEKH